MIVFLTSATLLGRFCAQALVLPVQQQLCAHEVTHIDRYLNRFFLAYVATRIV